MNLSFDQLPATLEEILNIPYDGEDVSGGRYSSEENQIITHFMCSDGGLKADGRGPYGKKSGHSKGDLIKLLDSSFPKWQYHDRDKDGNPVHMRSRSAIDFQLTRFTLPIEIIALMSYYARKQPEGALERLVWYDILVERLRLQKLGINKLTIGDYKPTVCDSPIIIREKLPQEEIDKLEMVKKAYPDKLKLNLKAQEQWEEQLARRALKKKEVQ